MENFLRSFLLQLCQNLANIPKSYTKKLLLQCFTNNIHCAGLSSQLPDPKTNNRTNMEFIHFKGPFSAFEVSK